MATRPNSVIEDIRILLVRELESLEQEVELFPDEESLWSTPPGITNSAGNLAMHGCGNLRHYIGAVLGETEYIRDREAEFGTPSGTRLQLGAEVRATIEDIENVLDRLPDSVLEGEFPQEVGGYRINTRRFLLHLCSHLAFHVGQIGYLRRLITGNAATSGAVSIRALVG